jgi:kynureninase
MKVLSKAECDELDRKDPLAGLREHFVLPEGVIYLDGNSLGALPKASAKRVAEAIETEWGKGLIRSWNDAGWVDLPRRVGDKIARLIGAAAGDVLAADSTSVNLFKVLAAALALQADASPDRHLIVSERGNFPTDLYIAEGLCALLSSRQPAYRLELVDDHEGLLRALARKPAVVMLTQVDYRTGLMHNMAEITQRVHDAGALVVWDLAHSAGAVPVELDQANADFAIGCGYKYLNGGPGAPAFVWTAKRHQSRARQPLSGWFGHAAPFSFETSYRAAEGAQRFLAGTPQVLGMIALEVGVDSVLAAEAHGGMPALRAKSQQLIDLFIALIEAGPAGQVLECVTTRDSARRGSQISFAARSEIGDGYALMQALIGAGVIGDFRAPNILRFGMTPLYLSFGDVFKAAAIVNRLVENEAWSDQRFQVRAAVT